MTVIRKKKIYKFENVATTKKKTCRIRSGGTCVQYFLGGVLLT